MKGITDISVTFSGPDPEVARVSADWKDSEGRYHVWFDPNSRTLHTSVGFGKFHKEGTIYKNPLVEPGQPGYFDTRKLDAASPKNQRILEFVFETINREGLIAKARVAAEQREKERLEAVRVERVARRRDDFRRLLSEMDEQDHEEMMKMVFAQLSTSDLDDLRSRVA